MLVVWLGLVLFLKPLRVQWWHYRLSQAANETQQLHYFRLLCVAGECDATRGQIVEMVCAEPRSDDWSSVNLLAQFTCGEVADDLGQIALHHEVPLVRAQAIEHLGMMKCEASVSVLVACLRDQAIYEGKTYYGRLDEAALREAMGRQDRLEETALALEARPAVSDVAAASLSMITSQSCGFRSQDEAALREQAIDCWEALCPPK